MQRFGRSVQRLAQLHEDIKPVQAKILCQPDAAVSRPHLLLCIPLLEQFKACHSSTPGSGCPFSHPAGLPSQQHTIAGLWRTATGPASTSYHQQTPASACTLTSAHPTTSQFGPADVARGHQVHTSVYQQVPPHSELMQSEPEPESADKQQQQQQQLGPDISLLNATQQRQWDHASNAHLGNILVKPQSHRKTSWTCSQCPSGLPHKWQATVYGMFRCSKSRSSGCPYCSGQAVCAHSSLAQQAPHLVVEWDTLRNAGTPQSYTYMSHHHAHWVCAKGHQWQARVIDRVHHNNGCPDCAKARRGQRAPILTNSSGHIMQVWDHAENAKAGLDPGKLTCGSRQRAHFICPNRHKWTARIDAVSRKTKTTGCPACSGLSTSKQSG